MDRPRITPLYTSRLSWVLIPGPIGARCVTVDHLQLDLELIFWDARKQQATSRKLQALKEQATS